MRDNREGRKEQGQKETTRSKTGGSQVIGRSIRKEEVSQTGNYSIITEEKMAD